METTGGTRDAAGPVVRAEAPLSRRRVLRSTLGAVGVAAGIGLLGRAAPRRAAAQATPPAGLLPGGSPNVPDAYLTAPAPFTAIATPPGAGGTVSVLQFTFQPPVPPREQNRYWQELEKRLGVRYDVTMVPEDTYREKLAAVIAGGELPDFLLLRDVDSFQIDLIRQGAYTDLTPYLGGEAISQFPNLAAFPPRVWQVSAIEGDIYTVPRPRPLVPTTLLWRQDWADKLGVPQPENADQFRQLMTGFTEQDPDGNGRADTFALGAEPADPFSFVFARYMFRVPNAWRLNDDGTLTRDVETPEFRQALEYTRGLFEAGVYHPDVAAMNLQQARDALIGGAIGGFQSGLPALPGTTGVRALSGRINPNANVSGLIPPGHDGGQGVAYQGSGYFGNVAVSARAGQDPERAKELLRILDYFAAPFGSEESIFINYGLEGVHHELRPDGSRVLNETGTREIGDLKVIMNPPPVYFFPDRPDDARLMQDIQRQLVEISIDNPTFGRFSAADAEQRTDLNRFVTDQLSAIILGRTPLDALDGVIQEWRGRGGDQIRREFEEAISAGG